METKSTSTHRVKFFDRRSLANLQSRHINLETETKSYLSCRLFFLGDALNTTYIVLSTLQNEVQEYHIIQIAYLSLLSFAKQANGVYVHWRIQRRWSLNTKKMLGVVAVSIIAANIWGMIGIWFKAIGYHNRWEFRLWNIWYGGMLCPWYSYSTTMVCLPSSSFQDRCVTSSKYIQNKDPSTPN